MQFKLSLIILNEVVSKRKYYKILLYVKFCCEIRLRKECLLKQAHWLEGSNNPCMTGVNCKLQTGKIIF